MPSNKFARVSHHDARLEVTVLPAGDVMLFSVSATATVDAVKARIFKERGLADPPSEYLLAVSPEDVLYIEFVKVVMSNDDVYAAYLEMKPIRLFFYPKRMSFTNSAIAMALAIARVDTPSQSTELPVAPTQRATETTAPEWRRRARSRPAKNNVGGAARVAEGVDDRATKTEVRSMETAAPEAGVQSSPQGEEFVITANSLVGSPAREISSSPNHAASSSSPGSGGRGGYQGGCTGVNLTQPRPGELQLLQSIYIRSNSEVVDRGGKSVEVDFDSPLGLSAKVDFPTPPNRSTAPPLPKRSKKLSLSNFEGQRPSQFESSPSADAGRPADLVRSSGPRVVEATAKDGSRSPSEYSAAPPPSRSGTMKLEIPWSQQSFADIDLISGHPDSSASVSGKSVSEVASPARDDLAEAVGDLASWFSETEVSSRRAEVLSSSSRSSMETTDLLDVLENLEPPCHSIPAVKRASIILRQGEALSESDTVDLLAALEDLEVPMESPLSLVKIAKVLYSSRLSRTVVERERSHTEGKKERFRTRIPTREISKRTFTSLHSHIDISKAGGELSAEAEGEIDRSAPCVAREYDAFPPVRPTGVKPASSVRSITATGLASDFSPASPVTSPPLTRRGKDAKRMGEGIEADMDFAIVRVDTSGLPQLHFQFAKVTVRAPLDMGVTELMDRILLKMKFAAEDQVVCPRETLVLVGDAPPSGSGLGTGAVYTYQMRDTTVRSILRFADLCGSLDSASATPQSPTGVKFCSLALRTKAQVDLSGGPAEEVKVLHTRKESLSRLMETIPGLQEAIDDAKASKLAYPGNGQSKPSGSFSEESSDFTWGTAPSRIAPETPEEGNYSAPTAIKDPSTEDLLGLRESYVSVRDGEEDSSAVAVGLASRTFIASLGGDVDVGTLLGEMGADERETDEPLVTAVRGANPSSAIPALSPCYSSRKPPITTTFGSEEVELAAKLENKAAADAGAEVPKCPDPLETREGDVGTLEKQDERVGAQPSSRSTFGGEFKEKPKTRCPKKRPIRVTSRMHLKTHDPTAKPVTHDSPKSDSLFGKSVTPVTRHRKKALIIGSRRDDSPSLRHKPSEIPSVLHKSDDSWVEPRRRASSAESVSRLGIKGPPGITPPSPSHVHLPVQDTMEMPPTSPEQCTRRARKEREKTFSTASGDGKHTLRLSFKQLQDLLEAIRHPDTGVEVKTNKWRLESYPKTFIGELAVDWFCDRLTVSRAEAVQVGLCMMELGHFEHAKQQHAFEDNYLFYRFIEVPSLLATPALSNDSSTHRPVSLSYTENLEEICASFKSELSKRPDPPTKIGYAHSPAAAIVANEVSEATRSERSLSRESLAFLEAEMEYSLLAPKNVMPLQLTFNKGAEGPKTSIVVHVSPTDSVHDLRSALLAMLEDVTEEVRVGRFHAQAKGESDISVIGDSDILTRLDAFQVDLENHRVPEVFLVRPGVHQVEHAGATAYRDHASGGSVRESSVRPRLLTYAHRENRVEGPQSHDQVGVLHLASPSGSDPSMGKNSPLHKLEKLVSLQIGSLIGKPLSWLEGEIEAQQFRKTLMDLFIIDQGVSSAADFASFGNVIPAQVTTSPMPQHLASTFLVKFHLPGHFVRTVQCKSAHTMASAVQQLLRNSKLKNLVPASFQPEDFVVKLGGVCEYVEPATPLGMLEHWRNIRSRRRSPAAVLLRKDSLDPSSLAVFEGGEGNRPPPPPLSARRQRGKKQKSISFGEINRPFELRVICLEDMELAREHYLQSLPKEYELFVSVGLYHGGVLLGEQLETKRSNPLNPLWCEWLRFATYMCELPRATRVCITLWAATGREKEKDGDGKIEDLKSARRPVGWVNFQLMDFNDQLQSGVLSLNLWPGEKANPIGTTVPNYSTPTPLKMLVELYKFPHPVVWLSKPVRESDFIRVDYSRKQVDEQMKISRLVERDSLRSLDEEEKQLLWNYRYALVDQPNALPKICMAVNWAKPSMVRETMGLLTMWARPDPYLALALLDARFADPRVREFAVECLQSLSDEKLVALLPQLIQVLKYEPYHDSPLARFLVHRALCDRNRVGHKFFWYLQAELFVPEISERFSLLLEVYLRGCGGHRQELVRQMEVSKKLLQIAEQVKDVSVSKRNVVLRSRLVEIGLPSRFIMPMNPRLEAGWIIPEKCRVMDSFTAPIMLHFANADDEAGDSIVVIFKVGDDLRQDILTLQMFNLMDTMWKADGLDLQLSPYGCIATGQNAGFIEVVRHAETTASIQKAAGGASAAFYKKTLSNWLRKNNPAPDHLQSAMDIFTLSCAGYCVATYVLGIGDRHNDNIMITRDGHFFHIDFAHFLGNIMKFAGINREKAPFVLTPQCVHVMGGEKSDTYRRFIALCGEAFNIIRKRANVFMTLFQLMLSTGIPQLKDVEAIYYLKESFALGKTEEEAAAHFADLATEALSCSMRTQANDFFHILAHPKKEKDI